MADLTDHQRLFVEGVLAGKSQADAYRDAGYKVTTDASAWSNASALMRNHKVRLALEEGRAAMAKRAEISADWVISGLKKQIERTDERTSQGAIVRAYELIGKHIGMWPDKPPAGNLSFTEVYDFSGLTHERVLELRATVRSVLASRLERRATQLPGNDARNGQVQE